MDILRNLFGSLTSGIIRLLVAVGILGAAYLFIVKPVLKTAGDTFKEANASFEKSFGDNGLNNISGTIEDLDKEVQRQIRRSLNTAQQKGHRRPLVRCIQRAHQDVKKIERCTLRY
jgi:hypothetical protein